MDSTPVLLILAAFMITVLLTLELIRRKKKSPAARIEDIESIPQSGLGPDMNHGYLGRVMDELRLLDVEKEIASYAITYLNEAKAKGRITEEEKMKLEEKYTDEICELDAKIERDKLITNLYEMISQGTKEGEEPLKPLSEIQPQKSIEEKVFPKTEPVERMEKLTKTNADERLEAIRAEVRKALEKLERMDLEG